MMTVYIVDANVIFSAILNINSGIGQFILKIKENNISLYAPEYLKTEIEKHSLKIAHRSKLSPEELKSAIEKIYNYIVFIDDNIIPFEEYVKAMRLVRNIDPDGGTFVALTNYMDETLWTGDTKLYKGLKRIGFDKVINFEDLKKIYEINSHDE